jgi:transposase
MTRPLSEDLRRRVIAAVNGGLSCRTAARRFGIAASTAIKWMDRYRRLGHARPGTLGGDRRSHRIEAYAEEILALIAERHDITLEEMAMHLEEAHGVVVSQSSIWRLLDRRGMTFKKNRPRIRAAKN